MKTTTVFRRYELKYLVTREQQRELLGLFERTMNPDEFGQSSIFNLYCDIPDFLLIRRSVDKPVYKEKLRLRSYGRANGDTKVFLELKKKYEKVVYKRRLSLSEDEARGCFTGNGSLPHTQIGREIDYFKTMYRGIAPRVFIAYDREAYFGKEDGDVRVTFDRNILWRDRDLSLCSEKYGNRMLPENTAMMEIKVAGGIPLWLTHFLTEHQIYQTSFSKYGTAYEEICKRKKVLTDAA